MNIYSALYSIVSVVLVFFLRQTLSAQLHQMTNSISGIVLEADSCQPLVIADLEILENHQLSHSDIDGRFKFEDIKPGRYTIRVTAIGYDSVIIDTVSIPRQDNPLVIILREHLICKDYESRALNDLAHGKVQLLVWGINVEPPPKIAQQIAELQSKYGFLSINVGPNMCTREYNSIVEKYLDARNGTNWWARYKKEFDQLYEQSYKH